MRRDRDRSSCSLGIQVRAWRHAAGLTQEQLARRAGISTAAVRDLEQGRVNRPQPEHARRLAQALGVEGSQWTRHSGRRSAGDTVSTESGAWGARSVALEAGGRSASDTRLRVRILGPLTVTLDGVEIQALPRAQRTVLAFLALASGAPVRLESMISALWDDGPPATAPAIVQSYVSRLRSRLSPDEGDRHEWLPASKSATYQIRLTADELDVLAFRDLIARAREAVSTGDLGQACDAYEQGLLMWRGEPLADVDALQGDPAVVALAEERVSAALEYADIAADSGRHYRTLPHLQALAARDPLDEALHARLILALAGTGRQAAALRLYEGLRQRLDEQLGVLPGQTLREAHAKILRQEVPVQTAVASPADTWQPIFQLPAAPADFTGRAPEGERLMRAISSDTRRPGVPVVAISGPPGIGKTALALYAAHKMRAKFPDGQLWAYLSGASSRPRDPADVLGELLRVLGVDGAAIPADCLERAAMFRSRMAGRKILVVADDAATTAQVRPLIPGTAGCALVVTSRVRLEDLDGAQLLPLEEMTQTDAADLLTQIIGQDRVVANPGAVDELVRACGALPLALRIVGAKLAARPSWPISLMVHRLARSRYRLRELQVAELSVGASIASSYGSLPELSRRAFRLLALLGPADFGEWVIGAMMAEPGSADTISELTSRSLITPLNSDATGEPRYRLHDLLRDYAVERLAEESSGQADRGLHRLLEAWLQLASTADSRLPPEPCFPRPEPIRSADVIPQDEAERLTADAIAWFTAERANLLTAVERELQVGNLPAAVRLAVRLRAFQHLQHRYDDSRQLWQTIADTAEQVADPVLAACARVRVGAALVQRGQAADALGILDQCVRVIGQYGDAEELAFALYWRGSCAWDLEDFKHARGDSERGIREARRGASGAAECANLCLLGDTQAWLGEGDQAVASGERALAIATSLGPPTYELEALHNLSRTCTLTNQSGRAVELCLRRIELSRALGDRGGEALSQAVLGDAYNALGRHGEAAVSLLRALPVFAEHRSGRFHALCLLKLGYAAEGQRNYAEATRYLEESLTMFQRLRLPRKAEVARQALRRCRAG